LSFHPFLHNPDYFLIEKKKCILAKTLETSNAILSNNVKRIEPEAKQNSDGVQDVDVEPNLATLNKHNKKKTQRKIQPLSMTWKQHKRSTIEGCARLFERIIAVESGDTHATLNYDDGYDYLRIYGTHEEVIEHLKIER
jgi:hypothetical protein